MEQVGYVCGVKGNFADVEVKRITACGHSCEECSGGCKVPGYIVTIPNVLNAKQGDYVEIQTKTRSILKYAFIAYMIPFLMLIFGIFIGMTVFKTMEIERYENYSFLTGLIFLVISYFIIKKIDGRIKKDKNFKFEMIRIL